MAGNIETAWHLWRDLLPALHYSPSVQSLQAMVVAAADAGYMEDAEELCAVLRTLLQQQLLDNEPQLSKQVASNNVLDLSSLKNDIPLPNASGFAAVQKEVWFVFVCAGLEQHLQSSCVSSLSGRRRIGSC
jgi:hypothetical protein